MRLPAILVSLIIVVAASAPRSAAVAPSFPVLEHQPSSGAPTGDDGRNVAVGTTAPSGAPQAQPSPRPPEASAAPHRGLPLTVARPRSGRPSSPAGMAAPPVPWRTALASSYGIGDGFLGSHLACGGRLDNVTPVVAHRSLPCGTRVVICFTRTAGKFAGRHCADAVVRDRGPFVRGRTWDLGPAVARKVHFSGLGTVQWRVMTR